MGNHHNLHTWYISPHQHEMGLCKMKLTIDVKSVGDIKPVTITPKTVWRSTKYVALLTGITRRKMSGVCRAGALFPNARKSPETGQWTIPDDDIQNALLIIAAQRVANVTASYETGKRVRPTTASCNRIRIKIDDDTTLTPEQRKLFTARIDAYQRVWDNKYAKYAKRGNNNK